MITPRFSLDQDENQLIITVYAPYTSIKQTEIVVHEDDVRFYSSPYYLRLNLPGKVEETDRSSASYDSDKSTFVIRLDKTTPGEVFPNLNMLTSFLQPKGGKKKQTKPLIEVIDDGCSSSAETNVQEEMDEEEWSVEQTVEEEVSAESLLNQYKYGFANNHSGLGKTHEVELSEVNVIKNPDSLAPSERRKMKEEDETEKFSDDHYLSDLLMGDDVPRLEKFKFSTSSLKTLTDKNRDCLKDLGNREFLLDTVWQKRLHLGLIDILFAYCYDWRTSEGSHTIESAWNISRVSATLSWFDVFETVNDVVRSCMRRSLSYPLYRNWDLSKKVFKDVSKVLKSGQTGILICLLDIHDVFSKKDPYYILNQLYIQEYCVWAQSMLPSNLDTINGALVKAVAEIQKDDVNFDLCELEVAAKLVEDEEMEEEITSNVERICIS